MKRDMDLVRALLLDAERNIRPGMRLPAVATIEGYDDATIAQHLRLMHQEGLIRANILHTDQSGALSGSILEITWKGHDFLELARDQGRWGRAMTEIKKKGSAATIEIVSGVLAKLAAAAMGLS